MPSVASKCQAHNLPTTPQSQGFHKYSQYYDTGVRFYLSVWFSRLSAVCVCPSVHCPVSAQCFEAWLPVQR